MELDKPTTKVFVYWNLHRDLWSLKAVDGDARGKVIAHVQHAMLLDCSYRVSEAGRQRVIRERCKNVHAGVVGTLVACAGRGRASTDLAAMACERWAESLSGLQ